MKPINIFIIEAHSTGKITLRNALLKGIHHDKNKGIALQDIEQPMTTTEAAEIIMERMGLMANEVFSSKETCERIQNEILEEQAAYERKIPDDAWINSDRSGLDPIIYALVHVDASAAARMESTEAWDECKASMEKGLMVVCEPVKEWLETNKFRTWLEGMTQWDYARLLHGTFVDRLEVLGISYVLIPASMRDMKQRIERVLGEWRQKMETIAGAQG